MELQIPIKRLCDLGVNCSVILSLYELKSKILVLNYEDAEWFEFLYSEQIALCNMKETTLRKYRNVLLAKGILEIKITSTIPKKTLYKINQQNLFKYGY